MRGFGSKSNEDQQVVQLENPLAFRRFWPGFCPCRILRNEFREKKDKMKEYTRGRRNTVLGQSRCIGGGVVRFQWNSGLMIYKAFKQRWIVVVGEQAFGYLNGGPNR